MADIMAVLAAQGWVGSADAERADTTSSGRKKAIFIRLPKCASTSIMTLLGTLGAEATVGGHNECLELCGGSLAKLEAFRLMCLPAATSSDKASTIDTSYLRNIAEATRVGVGAEVYDSSFKFAFVRNPYDRCVSSWQFTYSWVGPFSEFVELLAERGPNSPVWNWHERVHVCEQLPHLVDPSTAALTVDYVGRVEELSEGVGHVCRELGLESENVHVPHENRQNRELGSYREYYNCDRLKELVYRIYKKDIDFFEYTF
mmetsp:Transcript_57683/g.130706  ORF Transcript_57683/g.130706 Transcript_57683/m.130706 type:complete len:259 (+) Transcript_57683:55-831(+)